MWCVSVEVHVVCECGGACGVGVHVVCEAS